ncbi:MAG: YesL family protein, partial [Eubacterium sp.]|nr:YesL family protein [Eubacterium sp.]
MAEELDSVEKKKEVNYGEEEKIEKPTRSQRFFISIDKLGDLFFLNIYFFITCIPIVTIGAAFTALYTVTNKMVNNKEKASVKEDYFKAFKDNFKQSTIIWIIDLIYIYLMYLQYYYVLNNNNQAARLLFVVLGFEFILAAF